MNRTKLIYFTKEFHSGAINRLIHLIGILLLVWGVVERNILIVIIAPVIMEMGHIYNHFYLRKPIKYFNLLTLLKTQTIAYTLLALVMTFILLIIEK